MPPRTRAADFSYGAWPTVETRHRVWAPVERGTSSYMPDPERTEDGRYVVVGGRRWRASDPLLPPRERERLVSHLMSARRDVAAALDAGDTEAERRARARVGRAKEGLGERGTPWWEMSTEARRLRWTEALRDLEGASPPSGAT